MWITPLSGPGAGEAVEVEGGHFVIGRGSDCDLVVDDPKASRRHAYLKPLPDGRAAFHDLRSGNGSFVDDRRVTSAILAGGERIRVGESTILVSREQMAPDRAATVIETLPPKLLEAADRAASRSGLGRVAARPGVRRGGAWLGALAGIAAAVTALYATGVLPVDEDGNSVAEAVAEVAPSTVLVAATLGGERADSGTGWVYDAGAGLIATNAHVLNGGTSFEIAVAGELRPASVVGVAPCEDLALLRVEDTSGLQTLPLGSQGDIELGQTVVAVGFPGSASRQDNLTSTSGVVSVVRTSFREAALDVPPYPNVVQTDAAINPGNSGGPLVTLDGELLGVNSAGRTISTSGRIIQGQGYAIGVDRVREVLPKLRDGESIGWAGLSLRYQTRDELREANLPPSLRIEGTVERSGAAAAGLDDRRGWLLLSIGGRRVGNSLLGYCDAVLGIRSGRELPLELLDPESRRRERVTVAFD